MRRRRPDLQCSGESANSRLQTSPVTPEPRKEGPPPPQAGTWRAGQWGGSGTWLERRPAKGAGLGGLLDVLLEAQLLHTSRAPPGPLSCLPASLSEHGEDPIGRNDV